MKNIKLTRKETTFSEMKDILEDSNTINLNEKIKKRLDNLKSKESMLARKKRKIINESWSIIENIIISLILIGLMVFIWLVGINETNALNDKKSTIDSLNLSDCRITQTEDEHIKKGNGSMYALDIACIRGKSFEVFTPSNKDVYLLEKIGYDERMGNFIVVKHGELRWVYGHTVTELKEGESLKPSQLLGTTNISGMSTNYHLHIELWAFRNNIKFDYLNGEEPVFNEKSFDLRMQRGIVSAKEINEIILDFIDDFEGLRLKAYDDGKQYSIGYGTYSYKGEVITLQQAKDRARIKIQSIRERYNLDNYDLNIQTAVVSFVYNIGSLTSEQIRKLENGFYSALANDIKQYTKANGKELKGLVKRRDAENNLLKL